MADIFTNAPATLDFEEEDLTDFDSTATADTGAIAASNAQAKNGIWSCNASVGNTAGSALGRKDIDWPGSDIAYAYGYLYIDALGSGDLTSYNQTIFGFHRATFPNINVNTASCVLAINPSNGALTVIYTDGATGRQWETGVMLNENQWYEIELCFDISGANAVINLWVDGDNYNETGTGTGNSPARLIAGACALYTTNGDKDLYWDDLQCGDARIGGVAGVTVDCTLGTLTIAGIDPNLSVGIDIDSTLGEVNIAGLNSEVSQGIDINCTLGTVNIDGLGVDISEGTNIDCTLGSINIAGLNPNIDLGVIVEATTGAVIIAGQDVIVEVGTIIDCTFGQININGLNPDVILPTNIDCTKGDISISSLNADIVSTVLVDAELGIVNVSGLIANIQIGELESSPADRTLIIEAENRTLIIGVENRTLIIEAENRTLTII